MIRTDGTPTIAYLREDGSIASRPGTYGYDVAHETALQEIGDVARESAYADARIGYRATPADAECAVRTILADAGVSVADGAWDDYVDYYLSMYDRHAYRAARERRDEGIRYAVAFRALTRGTYDLSDVNTMIRNQRGYTIAHPAGAPRVALPW
jgi:hypothetical protein